MNDCLNLTVHFGESDRVGERLLSDALMDAFERAADLAPSNLAVLELPDL